MPAVRDRRLLAVLLTALHRPLFDLLRRARLPRASAAALFLVVGGFMWGPG